ncbi:GLUG motif-containing protein [Aneurinibacillus soli]|uniref:Immunoglobulin A1 protease n=1 Tax=Aneurinibacillus soli TaxID=1500254 RepID=A0A0U5C7B1_9BACL|nr:GLUG motif-containing protein [Aneurinibacillus soli]PYE64134.1 GLUG motif-containing protein [Aneurinibacillus soli]BAU28083.1 Immunoglobulin A1 protease precursor [Aneurinibacillus soli]
MIQKKFIRNSSGMTLIEIVVSLAAVSVLMLIVMASFTLLMKSSLYTLQSSELRGLAKTIYSKLTDDIHKAESIHVYQETGHHYLKIRSQTGWVTYDLDTANETLYYNGQPLARAQADGVAAFEKPNTDKGKPSVSISLKVKEKESDPFLTVKFTAKSEVRHTIVTCANKPSADMICIDTAEKLAKIGNDPAYPLNGKYFQIADIELNTYRSGEGWVPIGQRETTPFTGIYEGNGFRIIGLRINRPDESGQSLFGYVAGAAIRQLHLDDVLIKGKHSVGALAGSSINTTFLDCTVQGRLFGFQNTGGLVGLQTGNSAKIERCSTFVQIDNVRQEGVLYGTAAGGLIGQNQSGTVSYSSSSGIIKGVRQTGGLIGLNTGSASIAHSYSNCDVYGSDLETGGFIGNNQLSSTIQDCYASGTVQGGNSYTGGLIGFNSTASIIRSYATGNVTGKREGIGGLVGTNDGFGAQITDCYASGRVLGYQGGAGGLVGYNISGARIESSKAYGNVDGQGPTSPSNSNIGGLVGLNESSFISNSDAYGSATGISYIGGLVGQNNNSLIDSSTAKGDVKAENTAGGLVGSNQNSSIVRNTFSSGNVTGTANIGALIGWNYATSSVKDSDSEKKSSILPLIGRDDTSTP